MDSVPYRSVGVHIYEDFLLTGSESRIKTWDYSQHEIHDRLSTDIDPAMRKLYGKKKTKCILQ